MTVLDKLDMFLLENTDYEEFYAKKLKKFGVKSVEELSDGDKKKFFDEIEKEWTAEDE
ncbi:MAG: hypothetical protein KAS32_11775 [Candidatus Peribacteraceae bacterium]|nr:hypothetical protein [Candidatus Peribacteraceae bacterium]